MQTGRSGASGYKLGRERRMRREQDMLCQEETVCLQAQRRWRSYQRGLKGNRRMGVACDLDGTAPSPCYRGAGGGVRAARGQGQGEDGSGRAIHEACGRRGRPDGRAQWSRGTGEACVGSRSHVHAGIAGATSRRRGQAHPDEAATCYRCGTVAR